jgi:hypothetical protein
VLGAPGLDSETWETTTAARVKVMGRTAPAERAFVFLYFWLKNGLKLLAQITDFSM